MTRDRFHRVKKLFLHALGLDERERGRFLHEACRGDAVLREEVESLLERSAPASRHLQTPVLGTSFSIPNPEDLGQRGESSLRSIGNYRLRRVLDAGGMGIVYLAIQKEPRRFVALKVLRPGSESAWTRERLRREAHVLARLQHSGIAQVYDAGTIEAPWGPQSYLAMEYVRGESITSYASQHALTRAQRVHLLQLVFEAVEHAHSRGVIHLDLKPSNILIDESGQPKVIDFGVAHVVRRGHGNSRWTDNPQAKVGTLPYMSPEWMIKEGEEPHPSVDVYALGVIAHELLTGDLPDAGPEHVWQRIGGAIGSCVAKALLPDPSRRYNTVRALCEDMSRAVLEEAESLPTNLADRPAKSSNLRGRWAQASIALITIVLAALLWHGKSLDHTGDQSDADERVQLALQEADYAHAARHYFLGVITALTEPGMTSVATVDLLSRMEVDAKSRFAQKPLLEAEVLGNVSTVYRNLNLHSDALRACQRAVSILESERGPEDPITLRGKLILASLLLESDAWEEAETLLRGVLNKDVEGLEETHSGFLATQSLAKLLRETGRFDESEQLLDGLLGSAEAQGGRDSMVALSARWSLGRHMLDADRIDRAERLFSSTFARLTEWLGEEHPRTLDIRQDLARIYWKSGRIEEAVSALEDIVSRKTEVYGAEHASTLSSKGFLVGALAWSDSLDRAERLVRELVEVKQRVLGNEHSSTIAAKNSLGWILSKAGHLLDAVRVLRDAYQSAKDHLPSDHRYRGFVEANLGDCLLDLDRPEEAEPHIRSARDLAEKVHGSEHRATLCMENNLALCLADQGKLVGAERQARNVLKKREQVLGVEDPDTWQSLHNLASILNASGKLIEAEAMITRAIASRESSLGEGHRQTVLSLNNWALVLERQHRYARAVAIYERALTAAAKRIPAGHWYLDKISANLARCSKLITSEPSAVKRYEEAITEALEQTPENGLRAAVLRSEMGALLRERDRTSEAFDALLESVDVLESHLGESHAEVLAAKEHLALTFNDMRDEEAADALFKEVLEARRSQWGESHSSLYVTRARIAEMAFRRGHYKRAQEAYDDLLLSMRSARLEATPLFDRMTADREKCLRERKAR